MSYESFSGDPGNSAETSAEKKEQLEQLKSSQEFLIERIEEVLDGSLDDDRKAENLINIERQINDISAKMRRILDSLRA